MSPTEEVVQSQYNREQEIFSAIEAFAREHAPNRYAEVGLLAIEARRDELWKLRADSFDKWLRMGAYHEAAYSTIRAAMREVEAAMEWGIPEEAVSKIRHGNFGELKKCSTAARKDPEVWKAAAEASPTDFVAYVNAAHHQHLEKPQAMKFMQPPSCIPLMEAILKEAQEKHGAMNRNHALEVALTAAKDYWDSPQYQQQKMLESGYEDALTPLMQ